MFRDARWLTGQRVRIIPAISAAIGAAMILIVWISARGTVDPFGHPIGADFTAFWNAGLLANQGNVADAWDQEALNQSVARTHGVDYLTGWPYPPIFLLVAAALANLPYLWALFVWQVASLMGWGATLWLVLKRRVAWLIALACPITPLVLANGQNSFLTATLLGVGLLNLERRPWLAGFLFGSMTYKPQLGLVIGPLLLFTGNWRAIGGAFFSALLLIGLTLFLWGEESWNAFTANLHVGRTYMELGSVGFHRSASLFSAARQWGASIPISYAVQGVGIIAALSILWRVRTETTNLKAAAVCAATALSTPYLLDYDLALVVLGGAFLYAASLRNSIMPYEKAVLALIWLAPWVFRPAGEYLLVPMGPAVSILLAWVTLRRVDSNRRLPRHVDAASA